MRRRGRSAQQGAGAAGQGQRRQRRYGGQAPAAGSVGGLRPLRRGRRAPCCWLQDCHSPAGAGVYARCLGRQRVDAGVCAACSGGARGLQPLRTRQGVRAVRDYKHPTVAYWSQRCATPLSARCSADSAPPAKSWEVTQKAWCAGPKTLCNACGTRFLRSRSSSKLR